MEVHVNYLAVAAAAVVSQLHYCRHLVWCNL